MRISFFGGPGASKSTTAAWLFSELKLRHYSIEHIGEYVKTWAVQKRKVKDFDQVHLLGQQMQNEYIYISNGIKNIVTDSPVLLAALYAKYYNSNLGIHNAMYEIVDRYESVHPSVNIFLNRKDKIYHQEGRYQTEEEANQIDTMIRADLHKRQELNNWPVYFIDYNDRDAILKLALENIDK